MRINKKMVAGTMALTTFVCCTIFFVSIPDTKATSSKESSLADDASSFEDSLEVLCKGSNLEKITDNELKNIILSSEQVDVEVDRNRLIRLSRFNDKQNNEKDILDVVKEYNKCYFMAIIGNKNGISNGLTLDENLLSELNARQDYYATSLGVEEKYTGYNIKLDVINMDIKNNLAKVVLKRYITLQRTFSNNKMVDVDFPQREGYLLEEKNNRWYLKNVIFETEQLPSKIIENFNSDKNSAEWISKYSYENLPRSVYEENNFKDYYDKYGNININKFLVSYEENNK